MQVDVDLRVLLSHPSQFKCLILTTMATVGLMCQLREIKSITFTLHPLMAVASRHDLILFGSHPHLPQSFSLSLEGCQPTLYLSCQCCVRDVCIYLIWKRLYNFVKGV